MVQSDAAGVASYASDALAQAVDLDLDTLEKTRAKSPSFRGSPGRMSCNWYFQDVGAVTVGGLMTAFRIAEQLRVAKGPPALPGL